MRRKRRENGDEYGQPYCRFSFPLDLHGRSQIVFSEIAEGGVRASFVSKRNDPRLNQYFTIEKLEGLELEVALNWKISDRQLTCILCVTSLVHLSITIPIVAVHDV